MSTQFILSEDATAMIEALRNGKSEYKASICDAFADVVFYGSKETSWRTLTTLQEYTHLIDVLTGMKTE